MRMEVLLVGLMLVLVGAVAAAVPGPVVMAQDIIKTYSDPNFTYEATHFANGSKVYVEIIDPDAMAQNYSNVHAENMNVTVNRSIFFYVFNSSNGGQYYGNFTISTSATNNDEYLLHSLDNHQILIDSRLNGDNQTVQHLIYADYTPPSNFNCTVNYTTNKSWLGIGDSFNVTLEGEANGSAWFWYNGTKVPINNTVGGTYFRKYIVQPNESHNGTVVCYHADEAGNVNSTNTTKVLQVDTAAPVITIVSPVDGGWTNNNRTAILFNVTDAASGVAGVNATANGTALNLSHSGESYNATNGSTYNDGNITVFVNTTDGAGNPSNKTWHFMADTHAPYLVNFTSPVGITYNTSSVNFTFTAYDLLSDSINCSYAWDYTNGTAGGQYVVGWAANATANTTTQNIPDGRYYADYSCEDRAGNVKSGAIANFTVDTTPPVIYNVTANDTYVNENQTAAIAASISDMLSGVQDVSFSSNGTATIIKINNSLAYFNASNEGVYNITITATDRVGNIATNSSLQITVDNTPPVITGTYPTDGVVYSDSIINYNVTLNENSSWCEFWVYMPDGTIRIDRMRTRNYTLAQFFRGGGGPYNNGNYISSFKCSDDADNIAESNNISFNVTDTTPPGNVAGLNATGGTNKISLVWDAVSDFDVSNYTIYTSTASGGPYSVLATTNMTSYTHTGLADSSTHYYMVAANDINGNRGDNSTEVHATTNTASSGSGGGSGSSGGGGSSSSTVIRYHDDPPMPVERPIILPTPTPLPQPVKQEPVTTTPAKPAGRKTLRPLGRKTLVPMTGLLFKNGSFLYGLAALMALASVWAIWSASKVRAKRKWYEK